MATYNGATYVSDQVDSIIAQNYSSWKLLVRDDGSCDADTEMIQDMSRWDPRITVIEDDDGRLGVNGNFQTLLESACKRGADYFLLSDQDDVWLPDKLEKQIQKMGELENGSPGMPLLIHSDLEVVGQYMQSMCSSFMRYQGIWHEDDAVPVLLSQNFVTGCTVLVNRKLLDIALPIPGGALMHDWWLALCAAVFGHIGYIDQPLVKYRQHSNNAVGAKHAHEVLRPFSNAFQKRWMEGRANLFNSMKQAQALAERIREYDPENQYLALVEGYASLQYASPIQRLSRLQKLGVHAQSSVRQALLLSRLLCAPRVRDV